MGESANTATVGVPSVRKRNVHVDDKIKLTVKPNGEGKENFSARRKVTHSGTPSQRKLQVRRLKGGVKPLGLRVLFC